MAETENLTEQVSLLMDKIGDNYGEPLLNELIHRMEKTVADFHSEVSVLISELKESSKARRIQLNTILEEGNALPLKPVKMKEMPAEASEFEKRLEGKPNTKSKKTASEISNKNIKKKRRFFKRK